MDSSEFAETTERFLLCQIAIAQAYLDLADVPRGSDSARQQNIWLATRKIGIVEQHLRNAKLDPQRMADVGAALNHLRQRLSGSSVPPKGAYFFRCQ